MSKYCERVHSLIAKTVSLVCKSSLPFEKEIKVEGLLGITLDENQVFLIRIDEIFAKLSGSSSEVSAFNYHEDKISAESRSQSEFTDIPSLSTATSSVTSEANVPDNSTSKCTESFTPNIKFLPTENKLKDDKNEAAVFAGSEESTFCLPEMQPESCELKMECSEPDPDVMIVQPVGTEEDADLVSLCSTLDDAVNRIKRKHQQEDDKSLVLAPSGILDGYRRNVNGNRSSRRKPLKARQHIKADVANIASSPLEDLSNDFNSVIENAANSSPQGQLENIDDAKSPTDISTLDASMSLCTDANQLLASIGISMAGLTTVPAIIHPVAVVNEVATQDSTPETGSLLSSTSMGSDAFQQLPVEMQNFVTSLTRGQTRSSTRGSHVCSVCGAHFLNADDHSRHLRTHSKATPVVHKSAAVAPCSATGVQWKETCPFCDSLFGSTSTRNRHIRVVHERRVKWTCPICFHKITRSDNIKYHSCVKARRIVVQKKNGEAIQ